MEKIIEISDLSKSYDKERVFEHFDMDIKEGEMVAIAGPSGSGKTTLLNLISGLDCVYDGNIFVDGSNIRKVKKRDCKKIGMIYQDYRLLEKRSVWDNVMLPLIFDDTVSQIEYMGKIRTALDKVGIEDKLKNKKVSKLSGGQKQRVAIARAIVSNPRMLLADEPTGALDKQSTMDIMDLLVSLNKEGTTILVVSHDEMCINKCKRVIWINS